jgi:hypothetical protein
MSIATTASRPAASATATSSAMVAAKDADAAPRSSTTPTHPVLHASTPRTLADTP